MSPPLYVQSASAHPPSYVTNGAVTFTNPVTNGNLIVVAIASRSSGNTAVVSGITDNYGNAYRKAAEDPSPPTGGAQPLSVWYAANVVGGASFTVTAALQSSGSISLAVHEYRNAALVSVLDSAGHAGGYGTRASASLSGPTSRSNELLFGAATFTDNAQVTAMAGAGYTLRQDRSDNSCCDALFTEDRIAASPGSYTASFTFAQIVHYRVVVLALRGH